MKPLIQWIHRTQPTVAPRAGAWIETSYLEYLKQAAQVAPRAGAWIET